MHIRAVFVPHLTCNWNSWVSQFIAILLSNFTFAHLVELQSCFVTRNYIAGLTKARHWSLSWGRWIHSALSNNFFLRYFNFILLLIRWSPKWSIPHSSSYMSFVFVSSLPSSPSAHLSFHLFRFFPSFVVFLSCGSVRARHQTPRMPRRVRTCNVFHCVCARLNETILVSLNGLNVLNTNKQEI